MLKFKFEIEFDEERLADIFDAYEIKFTKSKITKLKKLIKEIEYDIHNALEEEFEVQITEIIRDEWED